MTQTSVVSEERQLGVRELLAFIGMAFGMFLAVLNIQIVGSSFDEIKAGLAAGPEEARELNWWRVEGRDGWVAAGYLRYPDATANPAPMPTSAPADSGTQEATETP